MLSGQEILCFLAAFLLILAKVSRSFNRFLIISLIIISLEFMDKDFAKYLLEKTKEDYNLIAEDFSKTRQSIWPETQFLLDKYSVAGEKILDLGCGNGRYFEYFKNKNLNYFGTDISEKLIEIAKKKYPGVNFQAADGLSLPFSDNFFDKLLSIAVLHHIPSKELRIHFLKEAKRILKPGGILILTVWNFKEIKEFSLLFKSIVLKILGLSKLDFGDFLEPWSKKTKRYYHYFLKNELIDLIKEAGFEIKENGIVRNERGNRRN